MRPSRLLLASIFITAIILVLVGGLTTIVLASKNSSQAANPSNQQEIIQAYQQREDNYNQLIQQANQQLDQANAQLKAMQAQMSQLQGSQATTSQKAPEAAVSADQAEKIAMKAAEVGQSMLKKPELVQFQGKAAYEADFDKGSIFIDAQSGEILYNGTVPQQITADQAGKIAADYLKNKDILQVDQVKNGATQLFRVIFKNGTMLYMDLTGQITYIQNTGTVNTAGGSNGSSNSGSSAPSQNYHEHDDGGEHD